MTRRFTLLLIAISFLSICSFVPANAQGMSPQEIERVAALQTGKVAAANTNSAFPKGVSAMSPHRWSKKKKVIASIVASALIGAAVSIPVAVHCHQVHEMHLRRARRASELNISHEQAVIAQQEQAIRQLLSQGPTLNLAQQANLQTTLAQLQQTQAGLTRAYLKVAFGHGAHAIEEGDGEFVQDLESAQAIAPIPNVVVIELPGLFPPLP
jgi:hypothetical protein